MKKNLQLVVLSILLVTSVNAQTYFHPTVGLQNTYVGTCEVNTCSGTYYDNGGAAGNYSVNIGYPAPGGIYRTFCPAIAGNCTRITFNSFALEAPDVFGGCYDFIQVRNGPTQNSPILFQGCGNSIPAGTSFTASNPSGCLTVTFYSDNIITAAGWNATISCVPCAGPAANTNMDCQFAQYVCDNLNPVIANSNGPGLVSDACVSGCALTENYSNWYIVNVTAGGTLGLLIQPTPVAADYDFAFYGPGVSCGSLGAPIRCSYAANSGNTGMVAASGDNSEDVTGNGFVNDVAVVPGTYYLLVNQWDALPGASFQLNFTGTAVVGLPAPTGLSYTPVTCANSTLQLFGPSIPGATYSWTGPGGWTSTAQNPTRNPVVAGTYSLTYSVNGCTSPASTVNVTIPADVTPPTITCPSTQTLVLNASCQGSLPNYTGMAVTADNCGVASVTQSPVAGTVVSGTGTQVVTLTVTDLSGNTAQCTFNVNKVDNTAPTITCPGTQTLVLNAGCTAVVPNYTGMATTSDNCSAVTVTQSPLAGSTLSGSGATTITLTATDASGNTTTCTFTVNRIDNTPPSILCPGAQTVAGNASCQGVLGNYAGLATASDNCATVTVTQSPASGTVFTGTQVVTLTATDASGNTATCTFNVTIIDNTPPTITCPSAQTLNLNASCQATLPNYTGMAITSDNCSAVTVTQSPAAGTVVSGVGTTVVTLTATDGNGNTATCTFNVNRVDNTPPAITCPANQTLNLNASCQVLLPNYIGMTVSTDNCGSVTLSQSPVAGTVLSGVGTTVVTMTSTDAGGNVSTCTFNVNRVDITPPSISCPGNQTAVANGLCQFVMSNYIPMVSSADNCGAVTVTQVPAPGTTVSGTQTVTMTSTDASGNTATCTFQVTVTDNTPPTVTCPSNQNVNANASCLFQIPNYVSLATITDNCTATPTTTQTPAAGTLVGLGVTVVTITATDANGNSANCTFNVTVTDNTPPTLICPPNQNLPLDANCQAQIPNYTGFVTVSDNCGTFTLLQSPVAGTVVSGTGTTVITITATDNVGNSVNCTFDAIRVDNTPPVITCPGNQTAAANAACQFTMANYTGMATTSDNCSAVTVTQSPVAGSLVSGTQTVTLTATDASGNTSTCTFQVTVTDNTPPGLTCPANQTGNVNASCLFTLANYIPLATATDNCTASPTITQSPVAGTTVGTGTTVVTLTATDANGNSSTCTFNVVVSDVTPPTITCPGTQTLNLSASCQAQLPSYVAGLGADNCGPVTVTQSPVAGTVLSGVGTTAVTLTATDGSGNTTTCTFNVNTVDVTPPSITCPGNQTAVANATCQFTMADYTAMATTSDNCSAVTVTQSPAAGSIVSGTQTVTLTATDASGNTSTCTLQVMVNDNTVPTITNCPGNQTVFVDATCGYTLLDYTAIPVVSDNCTATPTVTQSPAIGTVITVGTTTVTLTVSDANGNTATCTFDITALDNTLPVFTNCPSNISTCNPVVTFVTPTATDNCLVTVTQTAGPASGATFPVGTTTVAFTATDASGNTAICSFTVTIDPAPTTAAAGPDQTLCGVNTATMAANSPTNGTGTWTVVSGAGTFSNVNDPVATVTALGGGQNIFVWTISSGTCTPSTDTVVIDNGAVPSAADAGAAQGVCGTTATLGAVPPASGTGTWTVTSGTGTFSNVNDPNATISGLTFGSNVLTWTVVSGSCPPSDSTVVITAEEPPTPASIAALGSICDTATIVNLVGNTPVVGTSIWAIISGTGTFSGSATNPINSITGFTSGTVVTWTIFGGAFCPASVATATITPVSCEPIIIPTAFTPNGDGVNDTWELPFLANYPNSVVEIFTRWGAKIYASDKGYTNPWDGTYNGQVLPLGAYYFVINYNDDVTDASKGTLTVIR